MELNNTKGFWTRLRCTVFRRKSYKLQSGPKPTGIAFDNDMYRTNTRTLNVLSEEDSTGDDLQARSSVDTQTLHGGGVPLSREQNNERLCHEYANSSNYEYSDSSTFDCSYSSNLGHDCRLVDNSKTPEAVDSGEATCSQDEVCVSASTEFCSHSVGGIDIDLTVPSAIDTYEEPGSSRPLNNNPDQFQYACAVENSDNNAVLQENYLDLDSSDTQQAAAVTERINVLEASAASPDSGFVSSPATARNCAVREHSHRPVNRVPSSRWVALSEAASPGSEDTLPHVPRRPEDVAPPVPPRLDGPAPPPLPMRNPLLSNPDSSDEEEPTHMSLQELGLPQRYPFGAASSRPLADMSHRFDRARTIRTPRSSSTDGESEYATVRPMDFVQSMNMLKECGWYWGPLSYDDSSTILRGKPDGSFLVRDSSSDRDILALAFRVQGRTFHTRLQYNSGVFSLLTAPTLHSSTSVVELIQKLVEDCRTRNYQFFLRPQNEHLHMFGHRPPVPLALKLLYPVSRFSRLTSLKHQCRFVILRHVRRDQLTSLPLPKPMQQYLNNTQYYTEHEPEDF